MLKLTLGYEVHRSGWLRINLCQLGQNLDAGIFTLRLRLKNGRRGRDSNPRPWAQQHCHSATMAGAKGDK